MQRLNLVQVVIVAAVTAAAVQLVPYIGTARAYAPTKSKLGQSTQKVGPSGEADAPKPFQFPRGKESFYVRTNSAMLVSNASATVGQACDDKDDIAFSFACYSPDDARVQSERMVNWTRNDLPAAAECRSFNEMSRTIRVESHIFCLKYDTDE